MIMMCDNLCLDIVLHQHKTCAEGIVYQRLFIVAVQEKHSRKVRYFSPIQVYTEEERNEMEGYHSLFLRVRWKKKIKFLFARHFHFKHKKRNEMISILFGFPHVASLHSIKNIIPALSPLLYSSIDIYSSISMQLSE